MSTPTNYLRVLDERSAAYLKETGRPFWDELIGTKRPPGSGSSPGPAAIVWLCPFAPQGQKEVWAVFEETVGLPGASDGELSTLAGGILSVQRYWRDTGNNGFNLGIYSIAGAGDHYRMLVRMVVRTRFVPYARNDQSFFEVILGESATDEFPETIAADLRGYFK